MAEQCGVEDEVPVDGLGVGVQQQLVTIPSHPVLRLPRAIDPEAIASAGGQTLDMAMEHAEDSLVEGNPRLDAGVIEDA